jgi:hypothetical protein
MLKGPQFRTVAGARSSLYRDGDAFGISMVVPPIDHFFQFCDVTPKN